MSISRPYGYSLNVVPVLIGVTTDLNQTLDWMYNTLLKTDIGAENVLFSRDLSAENWPCSLPTGSFRHKRAQPVFHRFQRLKRLKSLFFQGFVSFFELFLGRMQALCFRSLADVGHSLGF